MKNSEHAEIFKGILYSPRLRGEKIFSKTKRICGEAGRKTGGVDRPAFSPTSTGIEPIKLILWAIGRPSALFSIKMFANP
jgi:hypothetical protein